MEVDDDDDHSKPDNSSAMWEVHIKEEVINVEDTDNLTIDNHEDANLILASKLQTSSSVDAVLKHESLIDHYHNLCQQPVHSIFENTPLYDSYRDTILQPNVMLNDWGPLLQNNSCYCSDCKILFPTINTLDQHKSHVHSLLIPCAPQDTNIIMAEDCNVKQELSDNLQKCDHCSQYFSSKAAVLDHLYQLISSKQIVSFTKNKMNPNILTPERITKNDDNPNYYRCPDCTFYCYTSDAVKHHIITIHDKDCNNITLNPCKFKSRCVYCGQLCENVDKYNNHLKETHISSFSKKRHDKNNSKDKQDVSNEIRKNINAAQRQGYRCKVCHSEFNNYNSAYIHRRSEHSEYKGHIISHCGKSEKFDETLYYKCKWCTGIFNSSHGAKIHSKRKHPKNIPTFSKFIKSTSDVVDKPSISKYKCKICGDIFNTLMGAKMHSKKKHPNKMYSCSKITKNVKQNLEPKTDHSKTSPTAKYYVQEHSKSKEVMKKNKEVQSKNDSKQLNEDIDYSFHQCTICKMCMKVGMTIHSCKADKKSLCSICGLYLKSTNLCNHRAWHRKVGNQINDKLITIPFCPDSDKTGSSQYENDEAQTISFNKKKYSLAHTVDESVNKELNFKKMKILEDDERSLPSSKTRSNQEENSYSDKEFILYKCKACCILFTDKIVLENHLISCKPRARSFMRGIKCDKCQFVIHSSSQESHEKLHAMYSLTSKNFIIKTDNVDKREHNIALNKDEHDYRKIFKCESCDLCFMKNFTLNFHCKYRNHNVSTTQKCQECGLNFTALSLTLHQRIHHKKYKYSYNDFCIQNEHGKIIKDIVRIKKEVEETNKDTQAQTFNEQNTLKDTIKTKNNMNDKGRIDCTTTQIPKDAIVTNINKAFGNKILYKCSDCNICFVSRLAMENHRYMKPLKLKRKLITCNICDLKFSLNSYTKHKNIHHDLLNLRKVDIIVKKFAHRQSIHNHSIYKCEHCDLCFMIPTSAENHEKHSHIKDIVSCAKCHLQFTSYNHRKHYKYHHEKLNLSLNDFHVEVVVKQNFQNSDLLDNTEQFDVKNSSVQFNLIETNSKSEQEKLEIDINNIVSGVGSNNKECSIPEYLTKTQLNTIDVNEELTTISVSSDEDLNKSVIKTDWNYIGLKNISKLYKCSKCNIYFMNYLSLQNHIYTRKHSFVGKPVTCDACGLMFLPISFMKHFNTHHSKKVKFSLEDFDIKIDKKCFYVKNQNNSNNTEKRDTLIDNSNGKTRKSYVECELNETSDESDKEKLGRLSTTKYRKYAENANILYKCHHCEVHFLKPLTFSRHLYIFHSKDSNISRTFTEIKTCKRCGLKFSKRSYNHHKVVHHLNLGLSLKDFEIKTKTTAVTSNKKTLSKINTHENNTNEATMTETATSETTKNITAANRTTTNDNEKYIVRTYSKVARNVNSNDTISLYRCNDCNLHFLKCLSLKEHLDTNHSDLSLATNCLKCGLKFPTTSLKEHMDIHHENLNLHTQDFHIVDKIEELEVTIYKTVDKATYKCEYCEKGFALQMALKIHLKSHNIDSSIKEAGTSMQCTNDHNNLVSGATDALPSTSKKSVDFIHFEPMDDLECGLPNDTENNIHEASKVTPALPDVSCELHNVTDQNVSEDLLSLNKDLSQSQEENEAKAKIYLYKCGHCHVHFIDKVLCVTHMTDHVPYSFKDYIECKVCNLQFPINIFAQHMYENHKNDFDLENVWVTEYKVNNENKRPFIVDSYYAISRVESTAVSTTTNLEQKDN